MSKLKHIWRFLFCKHNRASFFMTEGITDVGYCRYCWFVLEGDQE